MPRQRKSEQERRGERAAGQYLHRLLGSSARYRMQWEATASAQAPPGEVNQSAVCQVLAHHLWDAGLESDTRTDLPRILKDPVSRALRGVSLSPRLLDNFLAAFDFSTEDTEYTKRLYHGEEQSAVIIGNLPRSVTAPPRNAYRTLSLQHFHYVGSDGVPSHHRVQRQIRILRDGVASDNFGSDTAEQVASRIAGGVPGKLYRTGDKEWWVDFKLPRVLNRGDEHLLEFEYHFHYRTPPEPEFRLIVHSRVENVSLRVQFDPGRVPRHIWWAEWLDYPEPDCTVLHHESLALDPELAIYRRLDLVDSVAIGFRWEF